MQVIIGVSIICQVKIQYSVMGFFNRDISCFLIQTVGCDLLDIYLVLLLFFISFVYIKLFLFGIFFEELNFQQYLFDF